VAVALRLARRYPVATSRPADKGAELASEGATADEVSNFTLINLLLVWFGPMHERTLTLAVLAVQVLGSALAFLIRYPLAAALYPPAA